MSLFPSVLTKTSETYLRHISRIFTEFDELYNQQRSISEIYSYLANSILNFGLKFPGVDSLERLIFVSAEGNPSEAAIFLANQIRDLINFGNDNIFASFLPNMPFYNQSSQFHQLILMLCSVLLYS